MLLGGVVYTVAYGTAVPGVMSTCFLYPDGPVLPTVVACPDRPVIYGGGPYLVVSRTYGRHKNPPYQVFISLFLLLIPVFGPVYYGPPYC